MKNNHFDVEINFRKRTERGRKSEINKKSFQGFKNNFMIALDQLKYL